MRRDGIVYFAGDTAFGDHFAQIRERFGSPRLALLPIGAYEPRWFMSPVHMAPEEAVQAHQILAAETSIAIHHGTFQLADEGIDTPRQRLRELRAGRFVSGAQQRPIRDARIMTVTIDKHTLALISIVGSSLDVLGALYLAYDLLGGEHGPLRTLTRAVTYGALFGTGYGLALGPCLRPGERCGAWHHSRLGIFARFPARAAAGILAGRGHERDPRMRFCSGRVAIYLARASASLLAC